MKKIGFKFGDNSGNDKFDDMNFNQIQYQESLTKFQKLLKQIIEVRNQRVSEQYNQKVENEEEI